MGACRFCIWRYCFRRLFFGIIKTKRGGKRYADDLQISINWRDHMPPHFHASYGEDEVIMSILDIEVLEGSMPSKQLKMLLGWAAFHQDELMENWELAQKKQELFEIEPLK